MITETPTGGLPVSGDDLLAHLRLTDCESDELAELEADHIPEAVDWLESELHRVLREKTVVEVVELDNCFDRFELSRHPVSSVTSLEKYDSDLAAYVEIAATDYEAVIGAGGVGIVRQVCSDTLAACDCSVKCPVLFRFTYTAGYTDATIPGKYKRAIKLAAAHLYTFRESTVESRLVDVPLGLKRLIGLLKRRRAIA